VAGVVPLLLALLAACGSPAVGPATPLVGEPTAAPAPATALPAPTSANASQAPADILRWSIEGLSDLTSLDPARPGDAPNNAVITLIYAGLVRLDDKLQVVPDGASDWKVTGDGKVYTFTIREGLKFGDGTPVTAGDFVYSINRALAPETAAFGAAGHFGHIIGASDVIEGKTKQLSGVKALDDKTLEITLDSPIAYFLALLTYPDTFVVPRKLVESGDKWQEQAYGTGPYMI
jgi:ABC-type transport system substrate-binding protein